MGVPGLLSRYTCPECGDMMVYETSDSLVCENCGYGVDEDMYGVTQDEYDSLYPSKNDVLMELGEYKGEEEDGDGEYYDPESDGMLDYDTMDSF